MPIQMREFMSLPSNVSMKRMMKLLRCSYANLYKP